MPYAQVMAESRDGEEIPYGEMTAREAGRLGGEKTKQRGPEYYKRIGKMGGIATRKNQDPDFYKRIGKIGGEKVRDTQGTDFYQKIGEMGGAKIKEMLEAGKKAIKKKRP